jgi:glycosyltransferase involved in cell wall biosynthesis
LDLCDVADALPLFVCLDATFQQLSASPWFAPNRGSKLFLPMTLAPIRDAERRVFSRAHRLLPWSEPVRDSLLHEYGIPAEKISILPPSMDLEKLRPGPQQDARPRILFLGGDFKRKGGMLVLDCYRRHFADRCDLHLITHSPIEPEPGVFVHHGIQAYSPEWFEQWRAADIFVFPSTLETFGIVLLEALAFEVPTISTEVGAAKHILADGKAGWLLGSQTAESLAGAISDVLDHPEAARQKTRAGRMRVEEHFEISANTRRLARLLHEAVAVRQKETATVTA